MLLRQKLTMSKIAKLLCKVDYKTVSNSTSSCCRQFREKDISFEQLLFNNVKFADLFLENHLSKSEISWYL